MRRYEKSPKTVLTFRFFAFIRLQDDFHTDFLNSQAQFFVKPYGFDVISPSVERNVIISVSPCVIHDVLVKRFADVFAARAFVYAKIVDIQNFDVSHIVVICELFMYAKRISHYFIGNRRNENRAQIVFYYLDQLFSDQIKKAVGYTFALIYPQTTLALPFPPTQSKSQPLGCSSHSQ